MNSDTQPISRTAERATLMAPETSPWMFVPVSFAVSDKETGVTIGDHHLCVILSKDRAAFINDINEVIERYAI